MQRGILYLAIGLAVANLAATVDAQEYPNRPVHVLAAAAPGGNPDVLARLLSQRLADVLGQPFVVENVPGAGGILAAKRIAEASPDGYLLMLNDSGALAININMSPDANYQLKDFAPITQVFIAANLLVVAEFPKSSVYPYAVYKQGWCYIMRHCAGERLVDRRDPGWMVRSAKRDFAYQGGNAARLMRERSQTCRILARYTDLRRGRHQGF